MSVSTIQPNPHTEARPSSWPDLGLAESRRIAWAAALIVLLLIAMYYRVLWKLVVDWREIPDASHGFLVPPLPRTWYGRGERPYAELSSGQPGAALPSSLPGRPFWFWGCLARNCSSPASRFSSSSRG